MKLFLITLIIATLFAVSSLAASFKVEYYQKRNFKGGVKGSQQGSLEPGGHLGRPSANLTNIKSIKANKWLKVTVFSDYSFHGKSRSFVGSQKNVNIPFTIRSIQLDNLQKKK
ncbi:unnamed protein product [Cunninghamella blakesleeana]